VARGAQEVKFNFLCLLFAARAMRSNTHDKLWDGYSRGGGPAVFGRLHRSVNQAAAELRRRRRLVLCYRNIIPKKISVCSPFPPNLCLRGRHFDSRTNNKLGINQQANFNFTAPTSASNMLVCKMILAVQQEPDTAAAVRRHG